MNMTVNYNFMLDRVTDLYTKFNGMDGREICRQSGSELYYRLCKRSNARSSVSWIFTARRDQK